MQVLAYQCYVGHRVPFSNTERHLSVTRVNFTRVFFDNPGYFGDSGQGVPDQMVCE